MHLAHAVPQLNFTRSGDACVVQEGPKVFDFFLFCLKLKFGPFGVIKFDFLADGNSILNKNCYYCC